MGSKMKMRIWKRLVGLLLSAALLTGAMPAALAVEKESGGFRWKQVDNSAVTASVKRQSVPRGAAEPSYDDDETVRVSIELKDVPTMERFSLERNGEYAADSAARAYRSRLEARQQAMANTISRQALSGKKLDVVWNLTLAANIISANVEYGKIEDIKKVAGVKSVFMERQYAPDAASIGGADPHMQVSSDMTGTQSGAWANGYRGQGMRVAVIDTGLDTDHQSFDEEAFEHALEEDARKDGREKADYDLLDEEELAGILPELNAYENGGVTAQGFYRSAKIPYGYCYVDKDLDITHNDDDHGEHGSHVAGIATANRYLKTGAKGDDSDYTPALEAVRMTGQAPDAQVLVMKVFGGNGGAYDSDYMAAVEDAILLGCDTVNLSLGSANPGFAVEPNYVYQGILDSLVSENVIVTVSAGNSGAWADMAVTGGALYSGDVSFSTTGSPGSYTNSLCVASVDNNGVIGKYFTVGGRDVLYVVAEHSPDLSALDPGGTGTQFSYMLLESADTAPSSYAGARGKVAFFGWSSSSVWESVENARNAGAAACVICSESSSPKRFDLTGYAGSMPIASISQEGFDAIKEQGASGTVTVCSGLRISGGGQASPQYTMSDFSSWGVPGDLSLKPEITAPGGNIWSVNGLEPGHDQYELMSGTSMAAPQAAGIGALVKQFIEEKGYSQKPSGLTDRALAQSLMMSTATPLKDENGRYYPVLQQGAGLLNAAAATSADSYVTVEGQEDGKVKLELGDDPDKTGEYRATFSIHNLDGEAREYELSGGLFTQAVQAGEDGVTLLAKDTEELESDVSWSVEGAVPAPDRSVRGCDFNGDGAVDRKDAQLLLDHVVKGEELAQNEDKADIDGDGTVDTHDVHQFLKGLDVLSTIVPAGGSITVTASITLDGEAAAARLEDCPNGFYVEGYLRAAGRAVDSGETGTAHSIPLLGYYGNWSDPSMLEKRSALEYAYDSEHTLPLPYTGETDRLNYLVIEYADKFYGMFGGNPYAVEEDVYLPERAALSSTAGNRLKEWRIDPIRNAAASRITVKNAEDPSRVYRDTGNLGPVESAFFYPEHWSWVNTEQPLNLGWTGSDDKGVPLPDGTVAELSLTLAPEYYVHGKNVDWDSLGGGAVRTQRVTIDNTAPEVIGWGEFDAAARTVKVTARDNQYVAAVALLDLTGTRLMSLQCPNQTQRGVDASVTLDLSKVVGKKFLLQAMDYACNTYTCEVELPELGSEIADPDYVFFDREEDNWYGLENGPSQKLGILANNTYPVYAAELVNGYLFALDGPQQGDTASSSSLYAMPVENAADFQKVCTIPYVSLDGQKRKGYPLDMAYSKTDHLLYALIRMEQRGRQYSYLYSIDPLTGEVELKGVPLDKDQKPLWLATLAIDDDNRFYSMSDSVLGVYLYEYGLSDLSTAEEKKEMPAGTAMDLRLKCWSSYASTDWDSENHRLIYGLTQRGYSGAFETPTVIYSIDPKMGGPFEKVIYQGGESEIYCLTGLAVKDKEPDGALDLEPVDQATGLTLSKTELEMAKGGSFQLEAITAPWTLKNRAVSWTSSDPRVAAVTGNGTVTAVGAGTAVITATTEAAPCLSAQCTVSVTAIEAHLKALAWEGGSSPRWARVNTADLPDYEKAGTPDAQYLATAVTEDGRMYASTLETDLSGDKVCRLYSLDPVTLRGAEIGIISGGTQAVRIDDLAPIPTLSQKTGTDYLLGIGEGLAGYIINAETGQVEKSFGLNNGAILSVAGVAFIQTYQESVDLYIFVGADGGMYEGYIQPFGDSAQDTKVLVTQEPSLDTGVSTNGCTEYNSLVYAGAEDGNSYLFWSVYDGDASETASAKMYAIDVMTGKTSFLGSFPDGVRYVTGLTAEKAPADILTAGSLHSIAVEDGEGHQSAQAVTVDPAAKTVTVPIGAAQSTNGRFTLSYDPEVLAFQSLSYGSPALHSETTHTLGEITVGYADVDEINGRLAEAVFTYEPKAGKQAATVSLKIWEDGGDTHTPPLDGGTVEILLPAKPAAPGPGEPDTEPEPEPEPDAPWFVDVPEDAWYHDDVYRMAELGLVLGTDADHFSPGVRLTRGMLAVILYRLEGEPKTAAGEHFTDVPSGKWFSDGVNWAASRGIVTGYGNGKYGPNDPITREQLAAILWRYAESPESADKLSGFTDGGEVSEYAVSALRWAVERGIVNGKGSGILDPKGNATRAEAAAILARFLDLPQE